MAKAFHCRPSELMNVCNTGVSEHDEQREYFLNRAVYHFGAAMENDMTEAENKETTDKARSLARAAVFARWMNDPETKKSTAGRFRDPASRSS